jgi:GAF domain
VDALGDDARWSEAFPWLAQTGKDRRLRRLLEQTEHLHRGSAARLRALGREDLARRAERLAVRLRFDLDDPQAARRLYEATRDLQQIPRLGSLFGKVLEEGLRLASADRGNVQLLDPVTGSLRIVTQCGFGTEFLDYFAVVDDDGSACGRAARERAQTVIADVTTDARFAPHRDIAAAAAFRAVQSTPLLDRAGRLLGVISTHYPRPCCPPARDLELMRRYGELAGQIMTDHLRTSAVPPAGEPRDQAGSDRRPAPAAAGSPAGHGEPRSATLPR